MFGSCIGVGWERPLHVVTYPFSLKTTRKHYQEMQPAPWRNTSVVPLYGEVMKRTLLDISNACLGLRDVLSVFFFPVENHCATVCTDCDFCFFLFLCFPFPPFLSLSPLSLSQSSSAAISPQLTKLHQLAMQQSPFPIAPSNQGFTGM